MRRKNKYFFGWRIVLIEDIISANNYVEMDIGVDFYNAYLKLCDEIGDAVEEFKKGYFTNINGKIANLT